jgi:hypothetical protein
MPPTVEDEIVWVVVQTHLPPLKLFAARRIRETTE